MINSPDYTSYLVEPSYYVFDENDHWFLVDSKGHRLTMVYETYNELLQALGKLYDIL